MRRIRETLRPPNVRWQLVVREYYCADTRSSAADAAAAAAATIATLDTPVRRTNRYVQAQPAEAA